MAYKSGGKSGGKTHINVGSAINLAINFFIGLFIIGAVGNALTGGSLAANVYNTIVTTFQTSLTSNAANFWNVVVVVAFIAVFVWAKLYKPHDE